MFFDALQKTPRGAVVCVFDITDRLQHMFFRHLDRTHPANRGRDVTKHAQAIKKLYLEMDDLVGRTMGELGDDTVLIVMSDHGFKPFRRGVNLNSWLHQHGFLAVKGALTGADMFQDVDWSRTKAYAVGFGGIYLNMSGREANGTVQPGEEAERIKHEIAEGLKRLHDEQEGIQPVREVYDSKEVYTGPYVSEAPDLIVDFRPGHRVAWRSVTGGIDRTIIEDNERSWSGDHNFNLPDVPGMLFCNRKIGLTGTFYTSGNEREPLERKESDMTKKRHTPEQIVTLLRQVEVAVANGKGTPQACKEAAITEQTYYRWRKEYGGLKLAQAKRLKELEKENSRLKHVVAELSLEKQILREVAQGNS